MNLPDFAPGRAGANPAPRGAGSEAGATDLQPRPVTQSNPAGASIDSGGVCLFQKKTYWDQLPELRLGVVNAMTGPGAAFAPGPSSWFFSVGYLFCLHTAVSYPGLNGNRIGLHTATRKECAKPVGKYRENREGKDRDPLQ